MSGQFNIRKGHVRDTSPPPSPKSKSTPNYHEESHNSSAQQDVIVNDDPVLNKANEHHHVHIHHDANAEKGREEEVVYSEGATFEPRVIPHQDPQDHGLHHRKQAENTDKSIASTRDAERGSTSITLGHIQSEEDPQTHTGSTFYQRYRIYFHVTVWLFFTA